MAQTKTQPLDSITKGTTFYKPLSRQAVNFLPLIAFFFAFRPVQANQSYAEMLIFFLGFFFTAALIIAANLKPIMRFNNLYIIIYKHRKAHVASIYFEDISHAAFQNRGIVLYLNQGLNMLLPAVSKRNRSIIASLFAERQVRTEFIMSDKKPNALKQAFEDDEQD